MTQTESQTAPPFTCKSATFYLTYSFTVSRPDKAPVCPPELCKNIEKMDALAKLPGFKDAALSVHPSRCGPAPHLWLEPDSAWIEFQQVKAQLADQKLTLDPLVRLFTSGATCTFTARPAANGEPLSAKDLLNFLSVTSRKGNPSQPDSTKLVAKDAAKDTPRLDSLYGLFSGTVASVCDGLGLNWLDETEKLLDEKAPEKQNPWVVMVAEVEGEVAAAFCTPGGAGRDPAEAKALRIRPYEPDIAPIVFRSVADTLILEPAYLGSPPPSGVPGLYSINVDARLYVCMSRRSVLCICENAQAAPASYFVPGLVDICEMVRARWHSLMAVNKLMDRAIRDVSSLKGDLVERTQQVWALRLMLANSLEDPTMYIIAGDALSQIYTYLSAIFRLEDLRSALLAKMDLIDKIHRDARELNWQRVKVEQSLDLEEPAKP